MSIEGVTRIFGAGFGFAALVLVSPAARAEVGGHVDADLDLGAPMEGRNFALGGGGRFGWRFDFGPVWLQPEAGGSYVGFLCLDCSDAAATIRLLISARSA